MPSGLDWASTQSSRDAQGHKNVEYNSFGYTIQQIQPSWVQKKKQTPDLYNFSSNTSISPGTPMTLLFPALLQESKDFTSTPQKMR